MGVTQEVAWSRRFQQPKAPADSTRRAARHGVETRARDLALTSGRSLARLRAKDQGGTGAAAGPHKVCCDYKLATIAAPNSEQRNSRAPGIKRSRS
jgi:hypothetical protein